MGSSGSLGSSSEVISQGQRIRWLNDYYIYIIPSILYLAGLYVNELLIYSNSFPISILREAWKEAKTPLPDTAILILVGVGALALGYSFLYGIGHLINSVSSLLIDRWLVKKVLGYPIELFYSADISDPNSGHNALRSHVYSATYTRRYLHFLPLFALESCAVMVIVAFSPETGPSRLTKRMIS